MIVGTVVYSGTLVSYPYDSGGDVDDSGFLTG